jgi:hypothetical protein
LGVHVRTYEEAAKNKQDADPVLIRLLKTFLQAPEESSVQYRGWDRQIVLDRWYYPASSAFAEMLVEEISPENVAVYAMCRFSFYILLQDWWDNAEIDVLQTNSRSNSLLVLAVIAGCKPICESLIKRRMLVNLLVQSDWYGSAIAAAGYVGQTEIVRLLVQKGADVNMVLQNGWYGSALAAAAQGGKTEMVESLIQKGADVDMPLQCGCYGIALNSSGRRRRNRSYKEPTRGHHRCQSTRSGRKIRKCFICRRLLGKQDMRGGLGRSRSRSKSLTGEWIF